MKERKTEKKLIQDTVMVVVKPQNAGRHDAVFHNSKFTGTVGT